MMQENNEIFYAGGHAVVSGLMHKKYPTTFAWGHPFSTYLSYDRFFNPLLLVRI